MADYSLALNVKPLQLEDPLTAYGRFATIQNAQNQNALAQYQLSAAKRSDEESNALRQLFANPENVDQTSPEFIRRIYGVSPEAGLKYEKNIFERKKEQGIFDKTESELLTSELNRAKGLIGQAQTPEELATIVSNIYNPKTRTGKYFSSLGLDVNTALSAIAQTKNNPQAFYTLLESFASSGDKLIDNLRARAEEAQMRPQPRFGGASTETSAPQENALGMRLGTPAPTPTQTVLGAPVAGVANITAVPTPQFKTRSLSLETEPPAPVAAPELAPATTFAKQRLASVEQQIVNMQTVLARFPGNTKAANELKAAVEERNKLVAEDLASRKFEQEKKIAVEYVRTTKGVIKVNKADGTSELVLGPDGKPVMDVSAASEIDQQRHRQEMERQGRVNLSLEERRARVLEENARIAKDPVIQQQLEAARTLGRKAAENQATATAVLPKVITTGELALNTIDQMIGQRDAKGNLIKGEKPHPGFEYAVGFNLPVQMIPGTEAANFKTLFDQIKGSAFLQAFETLKGGGQISEKEGEKATSALNRMSLAQTELEFIKAALEFKSVVQSGIANAKAKTSSSAAAPAAAASKAPAGVPQDVWSVMTPDERKLWQK
jgi:hypothetical protein